MKRLYILLFAVFYMVFPHVLGNGISNIDSLKREIALTSNIKRKAQLSVKLTKLLWTVSTDESAAYGQSAYRLSKSIGNKKLEARALMYLAVVKFYAGDYDSSIFYSQKGMETVPKKGLVSTQSFAYNIMSLAYKHLGNNNKALEYAKKSYKIRKTTTDTVNIAGSLDNIAHIYSEMGQYEKALEYSFKALDLFTATGDSLETAKAYAGIANLYLDMDNYDKGLNNFLMADTFLNAYKNTLTYADVQFNVGTILLKKKRYDEAMNRFNNSLKLYEKREIQGGIAEAYHNIGLCYSGKQDYRAALFYMHKAGHIFSILKSIKKTIGINISLGKVFMEKGSYDSSEFYLQKAKKLSFKLNQIMEIKKSMKLLADLYQKMNRSEALDYYKQYISIRDSIEGASVKMKMAELEIKYETSKKEKKILKLELIEKTQRIKNQRLLFLLAFVVLLFIVGGIFIFFKRKNERQVLVHQNIISEKNKTLALMKLEQTELKTQHLEKELNYKIKQLTTHSLNMMQRSELLQEINNLLEKAMNFEGAEKTKNLLSLKIKIEHLLQSDKDWKLFKMYFENINKSFFSNLLKHYPNLTENEIRLSALIKIGLTVKETASILNVSPQSVKNARYRLKQKLKLFKDQDLNQVIEGIE